jgi:hypothetical protein
MFMCISVGNAVYCYQHNGMNSNKYNIKLCSCAFLALFNDVLSTTRVMYRRMERRMLIYVMRKKGTEDSSDRQRVIAAVRGLPT